ncbi:Electron transfer flavoprotein subunit alpha [uncultured Pleomorphomonas sp.]|uniref:Electron transfer flavoprotein subunit alpha n=1 Tax=uncultured Pleomorphomonas sp. TaxID=442121 RepID=A0A212LKR6_9HYPH|nr:FAD-binding protein [uncultured Pleomorphomonas sp.]SCM78117.1 Electron transfer flavoprotein subunit alpha [uncultured Pleomorphomonas sp.]
MTTLLLAAHDGASLKDATLKALTAALAIGDDIHVLVAGDGVAGAAAEAGRLKGVSRVLTAEAPALAHGLAEPLAALVVALAPAYAAVLAPSTSTFKNALPRAAALLDVMQISDITAVLAPDTFERPTYAGNALITVRSADPIRLITVRTASFRATPLEDRAPAPVEAVTAPTDFGISAFVSDAFSTADRPELTSARVVVSGGRALGSEEQFKALLLPLADRLGAAIGASRAAVDAGYAPNDWQVGQTGKAVSPDLYVAVGISGAIQHLAGMKDAKVIVAINKDAEAPIFQVADYGLVGDLNEIVPELTKALG